LKGGVEKSLPAKFFAPFTSETENAARESRQLKRAEIDRKEKKTWEERRPG